MLARASSGALTKENVAALVKEGDAGAAQLQKDMEMQAALDKKNKAANKPKETLEEALKRRKLEEVKRWQAATLLKEGKEAVLTAAVKVEQTGSAADLAVLEANVKRVQAGKPALSTEEASYVEKMKENEAQLKKNVGSDLMASYRKGMNKTAEDVRASVAADVAEATSEEGLGQLPYDGNADQLLPDSIDDPMLAKDGDYGPAFDPTSFSPDIPDDDVETFPARDETALDTDSAEEEHVSAAAKAEEEADHPEDQLHTEAAEGDVPTYEEKFAKEKPASPPLDA